jgi:hypothetical protein
MGFRASNINWMEVTSTGESKMLPAGGYVADIIDVEDVESKEYLRFTYEIAEGEHKGFFKDEDRVYTHQFTRSYKGKAMGFMRRFLDCVEASNDDFKLEGWDNDPADLIGKKVGIIVQREDYTNQSGEDRARMNVEGFASVADIRAGRFKLPDPKDNRTAKDQPADGSVYDADIPF